MNDRHLAKVVAATGKDGDDHLADGL